MSVGFVVDKTQVDATSGNLSKQVEILMPQILDFKAYLDATPDATLEAPPFNYAPADIALLKSGFNDLALLARIYMGDDTITEARDLGEFSRRMAGLV